MLYSEHPTVGIVYKPQFAASKLRRWIALSSILLVLVFNTLEAAHAHAGDSGSSGRCAICISGLGNTPAVVVHPIPVLCAVAMVAARRQPRRDSAATERTLFIRPPPSR
jgi:hypothetical protein